MKKLITIAIAFLPFYGLKAQLNKGPYDVRYSAEFDSPKKHALHDPIEYPGLGFLMPSSNGMKSFSFQLFSPELKLVNQNIVPTEGIFSDRVSYFDFIKLKNKTYFFAREVFRENDNEGIAAIEFSPKALNFTGSSKSLFRSSWKVAGGYYDFGTARDSSTFFFVYSLKPTEKRDSKSKEIIGINVFDETLTKLWGNEFEMPYTEAVMDNLGYTLASDGRVYLLARINDDPKNNIGHYEVLVFEEGHKNPKIIEIRLETYSTREAFIYEDLKNNIVVSGFYGNAGNKNLSSVDGVYMVKLDVEKESITKLNGGYYEIPKEIIKAYTSEREKRKLEKAEKRNANKDIGINNLHVRDVHSMPDGSTKIISEQSYVVAHTTYSSNGSSRTTYTSYYEDIFILSISEKGTLDWVKKIPKNQASNDAMGAGLSINTLAAGNDLHVFYIDNLKNMFLKESEPPFRHMQKKGGFLTGVKINPNGDFIKYNLGEIEKYKTNFFIRYFVPGASRNLISTERRKKKNILFSIDVK